MVKSLDVQQISYLTICSLWDIFIIRPLARHFDLQFVLRLVHDKSDFLFSHSDILTQDTQFLLGPRGDLIQSVYLGDIFMRKFISTAYVTVYEPSVTSFSRSP